MFNKNKKPRVGYQKELKKKRKKDKKNHWLSYLIIAPVKKMSFKERFIKIIIYAVLRVVIKPSKWKNPKKNYEIIDRAYKRVSSTDFVYIPSSIAFYLIIAFMPILSMIMFLYSISEIKDLMLFGKPNYDPIKEILSKFVPGMGNLLEQMKDVIKNDNSNIGTGVIASSIISLIISTWIASSGFAKLVYTESHIFQHKFVGDYWMNKLKGISLVIAFTIILCISLTFHIIINISILNSSLSKIEQQIVERITLIIGLFITMFVLVIFFYKFSPRFKIRFKDIMPGTMVTSLPIATFLAFIGSVTSIWNYGSYGVMGVIMYVGMACLVITYFIFLGLSVNAAYYKTFVGDKVKEKWTFSKK